MRASLHTPVALVALSVAAGAARAGAPVGETVEIACAPSRAEVAAALVGDDLWVTVDRGASWSRVASPLLGTEAGEEEDRAEVGLDAIEQRPAMPWAEPSEASRESLEASSSDGDAQSDRETEAEVHIAVGDRGEWAWAAAGFLCCGGPGPKVRMRVPVEEILGIHIDEEGAIWSVEGGWVVRRIPGAGGADGRWSVAGAARPVRGIGSTRVAVPTSQGVWIATRGERGENAARLHRIGPVSAVAPDPEGPGYYLVLKGRLARWSPDGPAEDLGSWVAGARRIAACSGGRVLALGAGEGWMERRGESWRASPWLAAAAGADGRPWLGTSRGPVPPGSRRPAHHPSLPGGLGLPDHLESLRAKREKSPGRPPCRRLPVDLLPRARLVAGQGRGIALEADLPSGLGGDRIRAGWYLGVDLTWRLSPLSPVDCAERVEAWHEETSDEEHRLADLWIEWRAATAADHEGGDLEALETFLETERIAELIRVTSGMDPRGEER